MSSKTKASGAQGRNRKLVQAKENCKLRKVLESYVKRNTSVENQQSNAGQESESGSVSAADTDIAMIASDQSTQGLIDDGQIDEVTDTCTDTVISSPRPNVDAYMSTAELDVPEGAESAESESHHELLPTGDISAQVIFHKDVGYLSFNPFGRPVIDAGLKENMVKLGASYFQNADAAMPKTIYGAKGIARGMTQNWFKKELFCLIVLATGN